MQTQLCKENVASVDDETTNESGSKMYTELFGVPEEVHVVACSNLTFRNADALRFVPVMVKVDVGTTLGNKDRGEKEWMLDAAQTNVERMSAKVRVRVSEREISTLTSDMLKQAHSYAQVEVYSSCGQRGRC